ncbi:MAG: excinuclease ABC subunit UvrC [Lentisphaeria bacterium]|nr:excinuclease ABC subunit UvrC [Lentisphaeria bacterium]
MDVKEFVPSAVPPLPGVYVYRDRFGKVIYVGKAVNLRRRMSSYFQPARVARADAKLRSLIHSIADWSFETVRNEEEALILESRLIKEYAPYYNILMRDDKRYLMLKIDFRENFPTLRTARLKKDDGARYYGPFPHGNALRSTMEYLLARFGLRGCRDPEPDENTRKHCMKRFLKDCCAPCTGNVSQEGYQERLEAAIRVLDGDIAPLLDDLKEKMTAAAAAQQFERAAHFRDVAANLEAVFGRKARARAFERAELPRSPGGKEAAEALQNALKLPRYPEVIIGFDNSNLLGTMAVSSMVTFRDGKPDRDHYRRFRVRTVEGPNDFATMSEVVQRHFSRLLEEKRPLPDLVLIDGGRGQLDAAINALTAIRCPALPVIGLAEREEEIYIPGREKTLRLNRHDPALRLLQAVRDESHRFAITYHRQLRLKRIEQSLLDDIPGIGTVRKQQLLRAFGSVKAIRQATPEALAEKVPGLGLAMAQRVLDALGK